MGSAFWEPKINIRNVLALKWLFYLSSTRPLQWRVMTGELSCIRLSCLVPSQITKMTFSLFKKICNVTSHLRYYTGIILTKYVLTSISIFICSILKQQILLKIPPNKYNSYPSIYYVLFTELTIDDTNIIRWNNRRTIVESN